MLTASNDNSGVNKALGELEVKVLIDGSAWGGPAIQCGINRSK